MPQPPTEEQLEFGRVVSDFFDSHATDHAIRATIAAGTGYDQALWSAMTEQLELPGMAIPEAYGGSGFSFSELQPVFTAMGATLACAPFFSTIALAGNALILSGDEVAQTAHLPGIAAGTTIATLAFAESRAFDGPVQTRAVRDGAGWQITGTKRFVTDGMVADLLLVVAATDEGPSLFAVSAEAHGVSRRAMPVLDETRPQAEITLAAAPADLVGIEGSATELLDRMFIHANAALAAEQSGGASRATDITVAYAKDREQFGRPIGSFQAVKHKCAGMLVAAESAHAAAHNAFASLALDTESARAAVAVAKIFCSESYFSVAADMIHVHGGVGFTWEHPSHLYFRRAKSTQVMLGTPTWHRQRLADHLLRGGMEVAA